METPDLQRVVLGVGFYRVGGPVLDLSFFLIVPWQVGDDPDGSGEETGEQEHLPIVTSDENALLMLF